jgi:hypothetical protein
MASLDCAQFVPNSVAVEFNTVTLAHVSLTRRLAVTIYLP